MESHELKTPTQVLQLLKEDLNNSTKFCDLKSNKFINEERFYKTIYNLILDNLKMTGKLFILEEQVNIVIKNEIDLSLSDSLMELLDKDLLEISHINSEGKLVYKITDLGSLVYQNIINEK
jgi:hypothetical protein